MTLTLIVRKKKRKKKRKGNQKDVEEGLGSDMAITINKLHK